jgi:hypothetical protein
MRTSNPTSIFTAINIVFKYLWTIAHVHIIRPSSVLLFFRLRTISGNVMKTQMSYYSTGKKYFVQKKNTEQNRNFSFMLYKEENL